MRVGNDIIDLGDPFNRRKTGDPRFLDRILNREERTRAALVPDPAAPWLWWAAKEAAFKVLQADAPSLTFQPRRFSVILFPGRTEGLRQRKGTGMPYLLECRVESPAGAVPVRIFRYGGFVHALAALLPAGTGERLIWGIARQDRRGRGDGLVSESAAARQALKQGLSRRFGWDVSDIAISPPVPGRGGPPRVFLRGRSQPLPVSISHDGRFVAYAFLAGEGVGSPAARSRDPDRHRP